MLLTWVRFRCKFVGKVGQFSVQLNTSPYNMIQFDASFEEPKEGTGFKYSVRISPLQKRGIGYSKTFKAVEDERFKAELFKLIESASRSILDKLIDDQESEGD